MFRSYEARTRRQWRLSCMSTTSCILISDSQFRCLKPSDIKTDVSSSIHRGMSLADLALMLTGTVTSARVGGEQHLYPGALQKSRTEPYVCTYCNQNCFSKKDVVIQLGSNGSSFSSVKIITYPKDALKRYLRNIDRVQNAPVTCQ